MLRENIVHKVILFYIILVVLVMASFEDQSVKEERLENLDNKHIFIPGDIILGGLFTVHIMSNQFAASKGPLQCRGTFSRRAFQVVEAMLLAVDNVNRNKSLLPGVKLGVDIKDTCGTVDFAVKGSLNFSFVRKYFERSSTCLGGLPGGKLNSVIKARPSSAPETVAIIGPDMSDIARAVSDLAGLFYVPVVSHSATSPIFADRTRFKYFLRTVPSDTHQIQLIVDLLIRFKWTYIILLTSDDEYGRSGRGVLRIRLNAISTPICTVMDEVVTHANIPKIVTLIKAEKRAKVIVVFSNIQYVRMLMTESKMRHLHGYTWIASDAWSGAKMVADGNENILEGMLGVNPMPWIVPEVRAHLINVVAGNTDSPNVWVDEFRIHEREHCMFDNISICITSPSYELSPYISSTMDAVYAVAHALHDMLGCSSDSCIHSITSVEWNKLIDYLENVTFQGVSGNRVTFDWYGSGLSRYQIQNLAREGDKFYFKTIGIWEGENVYHNSSSTIDINSDIYWNTGKSVPKSSCSKTCRKGQRKKPESQHPICCWNCIDCGGNTISNQSNMDICFPCGENEWPSKDRSYCLPIQSVFLSWKDKWVRALIGISIVNINLVLATLGIFAAKRESAVVRASSRSLCYILLVGVILFYLLPFFMIGKPTSLTCRLQPYALGLCFAVNVGTMLVKTNRIARIFSRKLMKTRRARFLSNGWQYLMVTLIVLLELFICLLWTTALVPPEVASLPYISKEYKVLACSYSKSTGGLAIWSTFNAGLVIICTYQAFLVRKVSSNYNEAKFIALTMITMCIIIIVFVPVYVGTVSYSREIICSFLYIFAGFVEYCSIFGPKLYIIIFRPEKNVPMRQKCDGVKRIQSSRSSFTSGCDSDIASYTSVQKEPSRIGHDGGNGIRNDIIMRAINNTDDTNGCIQNDELTTTLDMKAVTDAAQEYNDHKKKTATSKNALSLALAMTANSCTLQRIINIKYGQQRGLEKCPRLSRSESNISQLLKQDRLINSARNPEFAKCDSSGRVEDFFHRKHCRESLSSGNITWLSLASTLSKKSDIFSSNSIPFNDNGSKDSKQRAFQESFRNGFSLKKRSVSDISPVYRTVKISDQVQLANSCNR